MSKSKSFEDFLRSAAGNRMVADATSDKGGGVRLSFRRSDSVVGDPTQTLFLVRESLSFPVGHDGEPLPAGVTIPIDGDVLQQALSQQSANFAKAAEDLRQVLIDGSARLAELEKLRDASALLANYFADGIQAG